MKVKYFILIITALISFDLQAQVKVDDIVFNTKLIDFGKINSKDGKLNASYTFYNNGPVDLIIREIDVACGCTTPRAYKKRIAPGDSGEISAEFNPQGILGNVTKWIHVKGNFADAVHIELKFKAEITNSDIGKDRETQKYYPGQFGYLLVMTPHLSMGRQFKDFRTIDSIAVLNDGDKSYTVNSATDLPSYLKAMNLPLEIPPKSTKYIKIKVDMTKVDTIGPIGGVAHLLTDDRFFSTKEFKYGIELAQDFSKLKRKELKKAPRLQLSTNRIEMGRMKSGTIRSGKLTLKNIGKTNLHILRMSTDCSCAIINDLPKNIAPGEEIEVVVQFDSVFKEGEQQKGITLYTNDPYDPIQVITVAAIVE